MNDDARTNRPRSPAILDDQKQAGASGSQLRRVAHLREAFLQGALLRGAFLLAALLMGIAPRLQAEDAKPAKPKLSDEVEKAFAAFITSSAEARKGIAKTELDKLCDEVSASVKLSDEQRKKLETEATPAIKESTDKFAEKLDGWLRPFLVGYGERGLNNLTRWKPEQFASRPNVASSPQDSKAWEEAVKRVLTPAQIVIYQEELGDKTARRKREIAAYLKDAMAMRRNQIEDAFRLERDGIARELLIDKERATKLEAAQKQAVDAILEEEQKTASKQLLAMNEDTWRQVYGSGGVQQFDNSSKGPPTQRADWMKALATVLTPEELKRWEGTLAHRQERRERAAMMGAVAELEDKVLLSAEQRPKLEKIFLERWRKYPNNDNNQIYPMNLLRSGQDNEITALLTNEQQKRWNEFVRGNYGNGRNAVAPAKQAKPSGTPQPVDPERVFAEYFVKVYHNQRANLMSSMQEHVDEIVRVTSITGEPLNLLQVAAKGAVERVLDDRLHSSNWKQNLENNTRGSVEGVGAAFLKQRLDAMGESRFNTSPPDENELWVETLTTVLTEDQRKSYESVLAERDAYRNRAIVQIVLAQLDATLRISGEQADKLEPLLAAVVKDYWVDYQRSFSGNNYAIYPYYLPVMLSGIPETDRKAILTPEQLKQFDGDGQNRYNGWWENMKRQHDQRMKK
jgi:hypothetical protein